MDELLTSIVPYITSNMWLAPVMAFGAGILTAFSPCCLSSIPLVIGYVGGVGSRDVKKSFKLSLTFALGSALTYTTLGILASLLGKIMSKTSSWWYIALGALMMLMALQIFEVYEFIPSSYLMSKNKKKGFLGAFLAGILAGIFSSPCATPVLVALLAFVMQKGNFLWGAVLLLLYSLGHSVLMIITGTSVGFANKLTTSQSYGKLSKALKIIMGLMILGLGFYMFYLGF